MKRTKRKLKKLTSQISTMKSTVAKLQQGETCGQSDCEESEAGDTHAGDSFGGRNQAKKVKISKKSKQK